MDVERRVSDAEGYQAIADADEAAAAKEQRRDLSGRLRLPLMIGGPLIVLAIVAWFVLTAGRFQSTDNAYVQVARTRISSSAEARVVEVAVRDNQQVRKGQVLLRLDASEMAVSEAEAEAALENARLQARSAQAVYRQRLIDQYAARGNVAFFEREARRQKELAAIGAVTQAQAAEAAHAYDTARYQQAVVDQTVAVALADIGGRPGLPVDRQPRVLSARAALDRARLDRGYAVIVAPADGVVTKVDQIQVGDRVTRSQPLFWLISGRPWIEANFKEDQLTHMRIGQPATIKVDAYDRTLTGRVASFSPGTGSSFALLPAENATGNWVKVVQRLPVRIELDGRVPQLGAGLSARVKVDVRDRSAPR